MYSSDHARQMLKNAISVVKEPKESRKDKIIDAIKEGNELTILLLIQAFLEQFEPEDSAPFRFTTIEGDSLIMLLLRQANPSPKVLEILITLEPNMLTHRNPKKETVLHVIANNANLTNDTLKEILPLLNVAIGNMPDFDPNALDEKNFTALHRAAYYNRGELFRQMCLIPRIKLNKLSTIPKTTDIGFPNDITPIEAAFLGYYRRSLTEFASSVVKSVVNSKIVTYAYDAVVGQVQSQLGVPQTEQEQLCNFLKITLPSGALISQAIEQKFLGPLTSARNALRSAEAGSAPSDYRCKSKQH